MQCEQFDFRLAMLVICGDHKVDCCWSEQKYVINLEKLKK